MSAEIRANYNDKIPMETGQKYSKESHIPVLSPTHFKRTGSLKLRNEMRINQKPENTSTPTIPLRRHRSLVLNVILFIVSFSSFNSNKYLTIYYK